MAVPPNLIDEAREHRALPPVGGEASLSNYERQDVPVATGDNVLPTAQNVSLQRDGSQRWLLVRNMPPAQLWETLRTFWQQQGFVLAEDSRERGVMETDWLETHPNISQDLIRNTITKAFDNGYVAGVRNRYRTRVEAAPGGGIYIFVSQKGMREVLVGQTKENSEWRQTPNDPGLEAEYLQRMVQAIARAQGQPVHSTPGAAPQPRTMSAPTATPTASLGTAASSGVQYGSHSVELAEPYEQAWVRTGIALDRANFTIDDRNRETGLYFIRYVDPSDLGTAAQGFWNQVFHGKHEKKAVQYRVNVRALTPSTTRIAIVDAQGAPLMTPQADRILTMLAEQLR